MTAIGTEPSGTLTPVAEQDLAVNEALRRAIVRDLDRLDRVLGEPVTAVRRDAIVRHVRFLLDQLTAHLAAQDTGPWPAAADGHPDLAELGDRVRGGHQGLAGAIARARGAVDQWAHSAQSRPTVRSALRELSTAVVPVLDQDAELLPLALAAVADTTGGRPVRRVVELRAIPTRTARRLFWLLDDLEPHLSEQVLRGMPRAALWVLRNGFSGAYNRGSYLMWVGGGTGPAV